MLQLSQENYLDFSICFIWFYNVLLYSKYRRLLQSMLYAIVIATVLPAKSDSDFMFVYNVIRDL